MRVHGRSTKNKTTRVLPTLGRLGLLTLPDRAAGTRDSTTASQHLYSASKAIAAHLLVMSPLRRDSDEVELLPPPPPPRNVPEVADAMVWPGYLRETSLTHTHSHTHTTGTQFTWQVSHPTCVLVECSSVFVRVSLCFYVSGYTQSNILCVYH